MFSFAVLMSRLMAGAIKCVQLIPVKAWLALAMVGVLAGGYAYHVHAVKAAYEDGYNVGYQKGKKDAEELAEKQRAAEARRTDQLIKEQRNGQQAIIDDLEKRLKASQAELMAKAQTIVKEVTKYVTKESDARAVIPAGFVFVHQMSTATDTSSVAGSKPDDVDAPTAVTLSEIATVDAENYAECKFRSEVIDSWIEWYNRNKALWEHTIKLQQEKIVVE